MKFFVAPFWNAEDHRLRAGWRLLIQFIVFFLLLIPLTIFSLIFGSSPIPATIHSVGYLIGGLVVAWLMALLIDRRPYANFGFHLNRKWWLDFGFGLALGAFLLTGIFLTLKVAGWLEITGMAVTSTGVPFILAFLSDIVLYTAVGVNEELLFRGYHLKNLAEGFHWKSIGPRGAIIIALLISSALFGLAHVANPNADAISTLNIVIAGFALALPYIITGELGISIGLHLTWNLFEGSVYGFAVSGMPPATHMFTIRQSGPTFWTGGAFGPEAGMICIIWLVIGCLLTVGWVKWQRKQIGLHTNLAVYEPRSKVIADMDVPQV